MTMSNQEEDPVMRMSRVEEIVTEKEAEIQELRRRLEEIEATNTNLLERITTLEDRMKEANETILIMGGLRAGKGLDEMVLLDRETSTWKKLNLKLPCKNSDGGSALLNNEIYIFGGKELKKKLYKLDSRQMRWIALAEMNEGRQFISNSSLVFQGCIWVFGGRNVDAYLKTVEKYCPERNEWIKMPEMRQKRSLAAAAVHNEKIFVSGGFTGVIFFESSLKGVECFDPTSGVWMPMADMPIARSAHSMISDGSSLFVMGGTEGDELYRAVLSAFSKGLKITINTVWRIRPWEKNAAWEGLQPMKELRRSLTAKYLCCSISDYKKEFYAIGGWNNDMKSLGSVEIFDGETWKEGPKLPNACSSMSSVVIPSSLAETLLQC